MADLTTLENVKGYLGIGGAVVSSDDVLERLITAVSDWFQRQVGGRQIIAANFTETITHDGTDSILPSRVPVTAISTFTADGVAVPEAVESGSGWYLEKGFIRLRGWYIPSGSVVELAYTAGDAAATANVPADIEQAVIEMVALKYQERTHVGTSSQNMAGVSVSYLPSIVPQSVRDVVEGYRRVSV